MEKIITFRNASIESLMKIVNIKKLINYSKFNEWFSFNYKISKEEENFIKKHIELNELYLPFYNEQKLSIRFIGPILNKINFNFDNILDWYGSEISCKLNGFLLKGKPDFIVAGGISFPEKPYFFMQEYKKSITPKENPEYSLLAEMLCAIVLNKTNKIIASFVIGQYWKFVILEKLENGNYEYFVSYSFDSLKIKDLEQIYKNLQAVKFLYCK
ncbi:MAG: hypothetical protein B6I24_08820 [Bacteroidetes bacterium 4572_128]|nr:MAG: hypothetical protein B6I24_08820 [Bacteroidetes bacterium 4572_128]